MTTKAENVEQYISELPLDRKNAMECLRNSILKALPNGFEETMSYGMIGYVVPHSLYPSGYHCNPSLPLPFISFASQKNSINFYHMGIYADEDLYNWFVQEYPKHSSQKLDMGKSCIRFKKVEDIPFDLIGKLVKKITPEMWIVQYEKIYLKK